MPLIRLPSLMQYYTDKQSEFFVNGNTVLEAVRATVEKYPALRFHIFDDKEQVRRHINLFVNDTNIRDLSGLDTLLTETDTLRILPSITGGNSVLDSLLSV